MKPIRVVVIDDSAFMRKMITDILVSDSRIEVVAVGRNGEDGINKINEFRPDVVTLDVIMPVMDGITALKQIMQKNPLPVVMLSSVNKEGISKTMQAISDGAIDFIMKPSGPISLDINQIRQELITKVIAASQIKPEIRVAEKRPLQKPVAPMEGEYADTIIGVGTSTGGPRALQELLSNIPGTFDFPMLIVQHMPAGFTKSLAERLDSTCAIQVKEAENGEILKKGTAYIAPGNFHMEVRRKGEDLTLLLSDDVPPLKGHRPAVDKLFNSIAALEKINKVLVVLTGMGSDGSEGIRSIKERDPSAVVIAESEETAIVYGMPKAAWSTGYGDYMLPLYRIGPMLAEFKRK